MQVVRLYDYCKVLNTIVLIALFHFLTIMNYWNLNSESHYAINEHSGHWLYQKILSRFNILTCSENERPYHIKQVLFSKSKFSRVIRMQGH